MVSKPGQDAKAGLTQDRSGTNMVKYDPDMASEILARVAQGELLIDICAKGGGYCTVATFRRWVYENADLRRAFKEAKEASAMALEEEALSGARDTKKGAKTTVEVRASEVLLNQLRWSAARRSPTEYGDTTKTMVTVPVQINTSLDLGQPNAPPAAASENIYEIDAKVIEEVPVEVKKVEEEAPVRALPFFHRARKRVLIPRDPNWESKPKGVDTRLRKNKEKTNGKLDSRGDQEPRQDEASRQEGG